MAPIVSVEPVFVKRRDLPPVGSDSDRYGTLDLCLAAERVCGTETILGAQEIRGLWRIYPLNRQAINQLLVQGITLMGHTVQAHDKNPYIMRDNGIEVAATKLRISDIPISIADEDIESALVKLGVVIRSSMILERVRNKDGKLTRFLTGRRFLFITVPDKALEKSIRIGAVVGRLYHKEQPKKETRCSRCLEVGHRLTDCTNEVRCLNCGVSGHKRGDMQCEAVQSESEVDDVCDSGSEESDDDKEVLSQREGSMQREGEETARKDGGKEKTDNVPMSGQGVWYEKAQQLERGRQIKKKKQTKLVFERHARSATPKRPRPAEGDSPSSQINANHATPTKRRRAARAGTEEVTLEVSPSDSAVG